LNDEDAIRFKVNNKLPHRNEMLLIDGTAYKDEDKLLLPITIPLDSIFIAPNKVVTPLVMIEMLAQLCGSQHTFETNNYNSHTLGYLVGIDKVKFIEPVYAGDKLDLIARETIKLKTISRIKGEVFRDRTIICKAELTLYKTDKRIKLPKPADYQKGLINGLREKYDTTANKRDAVSKGIIQSIEKVKIKHEESVEAIICFQPNFVCFSGHFPGYPILPGIVILYAGWLLAEMCSKKILGLSSISKAKFARPIFPSDRVAVTMRRIRIDNKNLICYFVKITSNGHLAAKYEISTNIV